MPFPAHDRRRYSRSQVERILPRQRGVYGVFNDEQWLYVGHSDDIRASLIDHWNNDERLDALSPTGWTYEVTDVPHIRAVLLIAELRPVINLRARARARLGNRATRTRWAPPHLVPRGGLLDSGARRW